MTAERHHDGPDALMAAITGDPPPPGTEADGTYGSAQADVALLREHLGIIAHALSEPPAPAPVPLRPAPRRRLTLGLLAAACAAAAVTGLGWLAVRGGPGTTSGSAADSAAASGKRAEPAAPPVTFGTPQYLACARLVAEGTVTATTTLPGTAGHRVTLTVTHAYKSDRPTPSRITFTTPTPLTPGTHALIGIPRHTDTADTVITDEHALPTTRTRITTALPESRTLTCD